jgi:hypothetical protein
LTAISPPLVFGNGESVIGSYHAPVFADPSPTWTLLLFVNTAYARPVGSTATSGAPPPSASVVGSLHVVVPAARVATCVRLPML